MWPFTRKKPVVPAVREDGWTSALSGLNVPGYDKRLGTSFFSSFLSPYEAMELWRGDDIASRIVETVPNEGLREGWELCIEGETDETELIKEVTAKWEDLGLWQALWQAWCYENCYGGSGIYLGTTDGAEVQEELKIDSIQAINYLTVLEPLELQPVRWQNDPKKGKLGEPTHYRLSPLVQGGLNGAGVIVHASRIIAFPGIRVSRRQVSTNFGWGDSRLSRCRDVLRDFHTSWASAGVLVQEFAQAVYKIKGLSEIISFDKDKELQDRIRAMDLASSILRAKVVDADLEDYKREQTPVTGLSDLLDRFATRLAAAADMPVTLLMGQSPAGLNATGESDIRFFYDRVHSQRVRKIRPAIEQIIRIIFASMQVEEPQDWSVEFPPLWQPTEKEQAETRYLQAQVDEKEVLNQIVSPEEVREGRHGGRNWSSKTKLKQEELIDPTIPTTEGEVLTAGTAAPAGVEAVQDTALNGAQVSSLIEVVRAAVAKEIPRESAIEIITLAFKVPLPKAKKMLGPESFEPKEEEPKPSPFGGSPFPPKKPDDEGTSEDELTEETSVKDEPKADEDENRRQVLLRTLSPEGKCSLCNEKADDLEIDHVNGRDWQPREMTTNQRIERYWKEFSTGVKLRALCRSCNGTDGAHRSHEPGRR